jgi:hypothetical protein
LTVAPADDVRPLLDRFTADAGRVLPLAALWAHGSLALGDFQPGRSDLDLIALVEASVTSGQRQELQRMHEALAPLPLAGTLHCSYVVRAELADASREHLTWAHGELLDRVVTPVTRRELHHGGLSLAGPAPAGVVPAVTDQELAGFIRADLRDFWYPATAEVEPWQRDIWVDLGLLTLARARVTLQDGRLITKREALEVLAGLGAPDEVLRDIYQRRYETAAPLSPQWRDRRGQLARSYVRAGIEQVLALAKGAEPAALPCVHGQHLRSAERDAGVEGERRTPARCPRTWSGRSNRSTGRRRRAARRRAARPAPRRGQRGSPPRAGQTTGRPYTRAPYLALSEDPHRPGEHRLSRRRPGHLRKVPGRP